MIERTLLALVDTIITEFNKMAFVSGPRQVGKTTLAQHYQRGFSQSLYLNWDTLPHQKRILPTLLSWRKKTASQTSLSW